MKASGTNMIIAVGLLTLFGCVEGELDAPFDSDGGALVPLDGYLADASTLVDPSGAMRMGPTRGVATGAEPSGSVDVQAEEQDDDVEEATPEAERAVAAWGAPAKTPAEETDAGCTLRSGRANAGWFATLMLSLLLRRWRRAQTAPARAALAR